MQPFGLGNTRILIDCAQNIPIHGTKLGSKWLIIMESVKLLSQLHLSALKAMVAPLSRLVQNFA